MAKRKTRRSRELDCPQVVIEVYIDDIGIDVHVSDSSASTKDGQGVVKYTLCGDFPDTRDPAIVAKDVATAAIRSIWNVRTR